MPVYIIRAGETDRVKIGWAEDPEIRRQQLQPGCWEVLRIIRTIETFPAAERWMHRQFAPLRLIGEWFVFDPLMMTIDVPELLLFGADQGMSRIREIPRAMAKIAARFGFTRSAVSQWKRVPAEYVPAVSEETGIPRHDLRPDLYEQPGVRPLAGIDVHAAKDAA